MESNFNKRYLVIKKNHKEVKKIKIGILTFHNSYNYGAFAQAFALQTYLNSLNNDSCVEIIHYKNLEFTLQEYKYFLLRKSFKRILDNVKKIFKFKNEQKLLNKTKRIYSHSTMNNYKFDIVFFGSDSIWNYTSDLIANDMAYFGKSVNCETKASYAASFGPDKYEHGYPKEIEGLIREFDYLGVRDNNTKTFISNFIEENQKVEIVLDPTFLIDFKGYSKKPKQSNYILIYSYKLEENQINILKQLAKESGKELISVGYTLDWCDLSIPIVSSFEWIGYIENADFVFISMYHGTLLSTQLNKNFATFVTEYRRNKIADILDRLDLLERMIEPNDINHIKEIFEKSIDYKVINENIKIELEFSKNYIKNILKI